MKASLPVKTVFLFFYMKYKAVSSSLFFFFFHSFNLIYLIPFSQVQVYYWGTASSFSRASFPFRRDVQRGSTVNLSQGTPTPNLAFTSCVYSSQISIVVLTSNSLWQVPQNTYCRLYFSLWRRSVAYLPKSIRDPIFEKAKRRLVLF